MLVIKYIIGNLLMSLLLTVGIFFLWVYLYIFIRKDEVDKVTEAENKYRGTEKVWFDEDLIKEEKERRENWEDDNKWIKKENKLWLSKTKQVMIAVYIIIFVVLMYTGYLSPK